VDARPQGEEGARVLVLVLVPDGREQTVALARHFRDLRVYQAAFTAAMRIFELSRTWPVEGRYSLTGEGRRSSRSVCGNIAEAWRKRRYPAHFVSKLSDADGEAAETQNWLDFALARGYLDAHAHEELGAAYDGISGGLVSMMSDPDAWCGPAHRVCEPIAEYITCPEEQSL